MLSRLFRRLFLETLKAAFRHNQLQFVGEIESLQDPAAFCAYLHSAEQSEWVVYAKKPFGGPQKVLDYLGRYTHRVALSNDRIIGIAQDQVSFQWRDYRDPEKYRSRVMTVPADEFIRRFLIHTLPPGFRRIRYFGFLTNRFRQEKLELCRNLLFNPVSALLPAPTLCRQLSAWLHEPPLHRCPKCHKGILLRMALPVYRWPRRPLDSA